MDRFSQFAATGAAHHSWSLMRAQGGQTCWGTVWSVGRREKKQLAGKKKKEFKQQFIRMRLEERVNPEMSTPLDGTRVSLRQEAEH